MKIVSQAAVCCPRASDPLVEELLQIQMHIMFLIFVLVQAL